MKKTRREEPNLQLEIRRFRKVDLDRVSGGLCGGLSDPCGRKTDTAICGGISGPPAY